MTSGRPRTGFRFLDEPQGVLAFAHRGGALHPALPGVENTLAAFEHAVALGYRYLETDVHATRDGVVVAFHDESLERLTGDAGIVHRLAYADLAAVRVAGEHAIPSLAEVMERFPQTRFNIDIKSVSAVQPLADLVRRTGAHDRVCVGSFSAASLRAFRRQLDRPVATACGAAAVVAQRFAPRTALGVRLAAGDPGVACQVPHRFRGVLLVTPGYVRRVHAAGRHVHVWTVDETAEMHELLDMGVDGLFTDRTDRLRDVLTARGLWEGSTP